MSESAIDRCVKWGFHERMKRNAWLREECARFDHEYDTLGDGMAEQWTCRKCCGSFSVLVNDEGDSNE